MKKLSLHAFLFLVFFASPAFAETKWTFQYRAWDIGGNWIANGNDPQASFGAALAKIDALGPQWAGAKDIGIRNATGLIATILTPWHPRDFYFSQANSAGVVSKGVDPTAVCLAYLASSGASFLEIRAEYNDINTDYFCEGIKDAKPFGGRVRPGCISGFELMRSPGGTDYYGRQIPAGVCHTRAISDIIATAVQCDCEPTVGNPIAPALGIKSHRERVIASSSASGLVFDLFYDTYNFSSLIKRAGWSHSYSGKIKTFGNGAAVHRPNGSLVLFDSVYIPSGPINYFPKVDTKARLDRILGTSGVLTGFRYTSHTDDSVELYDAAGKLLSITERHGVSHSISYDPQGQIDVVTDSFGRQLDFTHDAQGNLVGITDPAGNPFTLGYDARANLVSISYPDNRVRQFLYNEPAFTAGANLPNVMTGIVDENNIRFATYQYDAFGRAVSTEHAGGVNKYVINSFNADGSTTVTNPLGTPGSYANALVRDAVRNTGTSQPCSGVGCVGTKAETRLYDGNANVTQRVDFNGSKSCFAFDLTRNLETKRVVGLASSAVCATELAGTPTLPARRIDTTWHPTYRLPATITEPTSAGSKVTTFTYDPSGNVLAKSVTVGGVTRTWSWTYDAFGRVLTATDPRNRTTTNTYYANDVSQGTNRGMLASVTNAAGHTTTITNYNAHGQPLNITDANGLTTTMGYDLRQRLTSRTTGSETTTYDYDGVGLLKKVTMPDGSNLNYNYDGAHRLVEIKDGLNNRVVYTLDNMGNRIKEDYADPANALTKTRSRVYDALNRLQRDIGGVAGQVTQFAYDANGNQTGTTDPLSRTTTQTYDALNRLLQVIDPVNGTAAPTKYEYDAQDNLTKVTDPKNLSTVYVYNGFNELTSQVSPDTGTTSFTYDAAGNMLTKTDARGVAATYTYDSLNRVNTISYPAYGGDAAETVTYQYDACSNGKGRLCSITDKTGTTAYAYNTLGRLTTKSQTVAGLTQTLGYRYNAAGQVDRMTLPSGKSVDYTYTNNRITSVTYDGKPVIKHADYEPFGPIGEWTWGNNSVASPNFHTRYFDLDGRNIKIESGPVTGSIEPTIIVYDAASRITALQKLTANAIDPAKSTTYGYDNLDRLTTVTPNAGNTNPARGFSYDGVGNRLTATLAGSVTNYNYSASSHRLNSLTGATIKNFSYDNDGNRLTDGVSSWAYGGNNRPTLISFTGTPLVVQAGINALGQRVTKTVNGTITRFMYDEAGRLVGEYDIDGKAKQETLWFNELPVAVIK